MAIFLFSFFFLLHGDNAAHIKFGIEMDPYLLCHLDFAKKKILQIKCTNRKKKKIKNKYVLNFELHVPDEEHNYRVTTQRINNY